MQVQKQQTECGSLCERVLVLCEMVDPDAVGISEDVKQTQPEVMILGTHGSPGLVILSSIINL